LAPANPPFHPAALRRGVKLISEWKKQIADRQQSPFTLHNQPNSPTKKD
jgi:hypothetical protein